MRWYHYVAYFFGGAFLANAVPHFVNGVSGQPFQSPFAHPPGEGLSVTFSVAAILEAVRSSDAVGMEPMIAPRLGPSRRRRAGHEPPEALRPLEERAELGRGVPRPVAVLRGAPHRADGPCELEVRHPARGEQLVEASQPNLQLPEVVVHRALLARRFAVAVTVRNDSTSTKSVAPWRLSSSRSWA